MSKATVVVFYIVFVLALFLSGLFAILGIFYPQKYKDEIKFYSQKYNLNPALVASVIKVESKFNEKAISNAGAVGLMQVLPSTASWLCEKEIDITALQVPKTNIQVGTKYLAKLLNEFGDLDCILACYNAGPTNVKKWLCNKEYSDDGRTLRKIPFKETEDYVKKVKSNLKIYSIFY